MEQTQAGYGRSFRASSDGAKGKREAMNIRVAEFKCNSYSFTGQFYKESHVVVCCVVIAGLNKQVSK